MGKVVTTTALLLLLPPLSLAAGGSVSEMLAERGHPHTTMCNVQESKLGLGQLPFIQFEKNESNAADLQEAVSILKLLAEAFVSIDARYVGFEATRNWQSCQSRDPEFLFWRDQDDNWRYMKEKPLRYLTRLEKDLPDEERGGAKEAYLLWSLGMVQQRTDRRKASVESFERAHAALEGSGDPNGILQYVLLPLIHHHFGEDGNESMGQAYLEQFALVSESSSAEGDYLPLIKVPPRYPTSAVRHGIVGWVLLEFTVGADGRVREPVVVEESPEGVFGEVAKEAALEFRYVPKVVDGELVTTVGVRNRIKFDIQ